MKKIIVAFIVVIFAIILVARIFDWGESDSSSSNTLASTTIDANQNSTDTPIFVSYPIDNETVTSPIHITGTVTGNWFFEGSFPIELVNSDGDIIGTTTAHTSGDWATTSDIDFSADISYPQATTTDRAFLLLSNDNPSGDPFHLQEKFIPLMLR